MAERAAAAVVVLATLLIIQAALPVHFFADNTEYVYLAQHYLRHPAQLFSPVPFAIEKNHYIAHLFWYRLPDRLFFAGGYLVSGVDPLGYNLLQALAFLLLVWAIYGLSVSLSGSVFAGLSAVALFLSVPCVYKPLHWLGSATLLAGSSLAFSLWLLFRWLDTGKSRFLIPGLLASCVALTAKTPTPWLLPILFALRLFLLPVPSMRTKAMRVLAFLGIGVAGSSVCSWLAYRPIAELAPNQYAVYRLSFSHVFPAMQWYARTSLREGYPFLLPVVLGGLILAFRRAFILPLVWCALYLGSHCLLKGPTTKHLAGAAVSVSILAGLSLSALWGWGRAWARLLVRGLIIIGFLASLPQAQAHLRTIRTVNGFARKSYRTQKALYARLLTLPPQAQAFTENSISAYYLKNIAKAAGRRDLEVKTLAPGALVEPEGFFPAELELIERQGRKILRDKLGDWRL